VLPKEFELFVKEMKKLLETLHRVADSEQLEEIERFQTQLDDIIEGEIDDDDSIRTAFWDDFVSFVRDQDPHAENTARDKLGELIFNKLTFEIAWGFWSFEHEVPFEYGYSSKHVHMLQGPNNPSGRHTYNGRPKPVRIKLQPVMADKRVEFYIASAPINQIDAISSVPSIKQGIRVRESARRILDPSDAQDEWQRGLMSKRILSISDFVDKGPNLFANSCMIFERPVKPGENSYVNWKGGSLGVADEVEIDFGFLTRDPVRGGKYLTDHTRRNQDLRPMCIIDGQHRVRGAMRSHRGHKLDIPLVIFAKGAGNHHAAKFFAEINTLSEELNKLHEIFMRHKFTLSSHKPPMKYGEYNGTKETYRDRANRLAYETAASLNMSDGPEEEDAGAMQNLILMLEENPVKNYIFSADMWVKFTYQWFMPNGPYPPTPDPTEPLQKRDDYFEEVSNYFEAFRQICNKDWGDGMERWLDFDSLPIRNTQGNKPLIQNRTSARSLLLIYPLVHSTVRRSGYSSKIISIERFKEALSPLGNIDWIQSSLTKENYRGTAEGPWKSLYRWMMDSLRRGEVEPYSTEEIHSDNIPSTRGKGLLSEISEGDLEFDPPNHTWPTPDRPVKIVATRPINSRRTCLGYLRYENKKRVDPRRYKGAVKRTANEVQSHEDDWENRDRRVSYTIHHHPSFDNQERLEFEVVWANVMGQVNSFIDLTR